MTRWEQRRIIFVIKEKGRMYFMDEKYSALFTPWKIGNVEIPNRIVQ